MYTAGYIIYHAGLLLYRMLLQIATPFNKRAAKMLQGRLGWKDQMRIQLQQEQRKRFWFHCASLGEFEQIRPLLEKLKSRYPDRAVVLTFFSPSGYEQRKNYQGSDYIFYLPFDSSENASFFLDLVQPEKAFFAKYDIWFHYLNGLKKRAVPTYLISANFRPGQIYFKWYGTFFKQMLQNFTMLFSQFEASTLLLLKHGLDHALTSGDTRFDNVIERAIMTNALPLVELFAQENPLLVIGSSYQEEERLVAASELIKRGYKIITAPHHIQTQRINECELNFIGYKVIKYSSATNENAVNAEVLIIDNIGILGSIYKYADLAFIGGGFGTGGIHNILEPLSHGVPVLIGPLNHDKFPETHLAESAEVCFTIKDSTDLNLFIHQHQNDKHLHAQSLQFVQQNSGATNRILKVITG